MNRKKSILAVILVFTGLSLYAGDILEEFKSEEPVQWGENIPGMKTRIKTEDKLLALTLDACGSDNDGCDAKLINFLVREEVPATLFLTGMWIDRFEREFEALAANSLFEIENHGLNHKPASVTGRKVYGVEGTKSVEELINEIEDNSMKIQTTTSRNPKFYRSGTAYYDDVAIKVIHKLGYEVAGFSVLGDAGATYSKEKVKQQLINASRGSIILLHMNHPEKETAEGVMEAIPILKQKGFKFVKLEDYPLE